LQVLMIPDCVGPGAAAAVGVGFIVVEVAEPPLTVTQ